MRTLYYNGNIYTMKEQDEKVDAILVEDGYVKSVGDFETLKDEAEQTIDLNGRTMLPAFTDVHLHMVMLGKMLDTLSLEGMTEVEEVKSAIKNNTGVLAWDFIHGYNEKHLPNEYKISIQELDEITDKPTVVARIDYHAGVVNSQALEAAGIDKNTPDPEGGYYERDENGELTGWVYDSAFSFLRAKSVTDTTDSIKVNLERVIDHLTSHGFASVHTEDMAYYNNYKTVLDAFYQTIPDNKKFRVNLLRHEEVYEEMKQANLEERAEWIHFGAMKIFQDGTFGSKTALMNEPYVGTDNTGLQIHTQENLEKLVQRARKYDDEIAVHFIGDKAAEMVLTAIEKYPVAAGKHDRMIHCSVLSEDILERMSKLPVICDIQPPFLTSDLPWAAEILGEERAKYLYIFKTMQDRGLHLGASSDAPIESIDPLKGLHVLTTRRDGDVVYNPEERLSRFNAVALYTKNAAKIVHKEHVQGIIEAGYYADFAIFDQDIMTVEDDALLEISCVETIIDGTTVFKK